MKKVYTTSGKLDGSCPHQHSTRKQAADCIRKWKSGHNDRHIYVGDPKDAKSPNWVGARKKLTEKELLEQRAFARSTVAPSFWASVRAGVEDFRDAVRDVQHQAELRMTMHNIELWTHAVSPSIHLPARKLLKALKAAGFGK